MKLPQLFLALAALCSASTHAAEAPKPNVPFILVDDFGSRDLGCYGSTLYETPNMDRLAQSGARFTQAYVAYPRCVPSRFAIFTGRHPASVQGVKDSPHVEPGRDIAIGQPFKDAGYATFYCGKWHLGDGASSPDKVGFGTIVVLASDHGGLSARGGKREVATSNRPLRAGKGHLYEGGLRIPLIVRWPGHAKAGSEIAAPVSTLDLFPTFLEMAHLAPPAAFRGDGLSLAGLLQGRAAPARDTFYWHNPAPRPASTADLFSSAIRLGDWKLLDFPGEKRVELYDLKADSGEAHNLADERPADRERLLTQLNDWRKNLGVSMQPKEKKKEAAR